MSRERIIRCCALLAAITMACSWTLLSRTAIGPLRITSAVHAAVSTADAVAQIPADAVCAECHRDIYEKYEQTSMARGGGLAVDGLISGSFHHKNSAVDYRVFQRDGAAWMSYSRGAEDSKGPLAGERRLQYYIGSGHRGRTYLYQIGSQWFELPINFYTHRSTWDMAPAFDDATNMPAPLPVDPNCLHCHATDVQPSQITAKNSFATVPYLQSGIGCKACHGDPSAHLAQHGLGPITNPDKLSAARRDSACIQCHLEGDAVVYQPGRSLAQFVAGDDLADTAVYFVRTAQQARGARATSQYEALLQSACKRAAGDKLTCTTCHDPHFGPPAAERVQYFRARCLSCHTNPQMAKHHTEQPDCAKCHMPSRSTVDISHEQVTDHNIEARSSEHANVAMTAVLQNGLVPVGNFPAGDREYGLAYAQMAQRGMPGAAVTALRFLSQAAEAGASDEELNVRLGYLNQVAGKLEQAHGFYAKALDANPYDPAALANLAVIDASTYHLPEATRLLQRLVSADPSQTVAGLNLAVILCRTNRRAEEIALLGELDRLNPDDPQLRAFMLSSKSDERKCSAKAGGKP